MSILERYRIYLRRLNLARLNVLRRQYMFLFLRIFSMVDPGSLAVSRATLWWIAVDHKAIFKPIHLVKNLGKRELYQTHVFIFLFFCFQKDNYLGIYDVFR